jgi:anti-anti-sigma factor
MSDALQITVTDRSADGVHIVLAGDVDDADLPRLEKALADAAGAVAVTVDARAVTFMNRRGALALLEAERHLRADEASLRVRGPSRCVIRVLELTGLLALLGADDDPPHR